VEVTKDEVSRAVEGACEEIMKATEGLGEVANKTRLQGPDEGSTQRYGTTYTAILSNRLPAAHQSMLARVRA